jgi:predicted SAM-dependent methyltransferase
MNLLNFGCGSVFHSSWMNVDIVSSSPYVLAHDIRQNLPYSDNYFDACYSSHVLEHCQPEEARKVTEECYRVLKQKGIIRLVVPDLESIAREYLATLEKANSGSEEAEYNYDWMMLELYDQTIRKFSGGEMKNYLKDPNIPNQDFIRSRIGTEAENFWNRQSTQKSLLEKIVSKNPSWFARKIQMMLAGSIVSLVAGKASRQAFEEGLFRNSGEIHHWMYDRYSLRRLLERSGFTDVRVCQADESQIPDFNTYGLDTINGQVRKPDSLFMEAIKP